MFAAVEFLKWNQNMDWDVFVKHLLMPSDEERDRNVFAHARVFQCLREVQQRYQQGHPMWYELTTLRHVLDYAKPHPDLQGQVEQAMHHVMQHAALAPLVARASFEPEHQGVLRKKTGFHDLQTTAESMAFKCILRHHGKITAVKLTKQANVKQKLLRFFMPDAIMAYDGRQVSVYVPSPEMLQPVVSRSPWNLSLISDYADSYRDYVYQLGFVKGLIIPKGFSYDDRTLMLWFRDGLDVSVFIPFVKAWFKRRSLKEWYASDRLTMMVRYVWYAVVRRLGSELLARGSFVHGSSFDLPPFEHEDVVEQSVEHALAHFFAMYDRPRSVLALRRIEVLPFVARSDWEMLQQQVEQEYSMALLAHADQSQK
jgi:hypothetical protein